MRVGFIAKGALLGMLFLATTFLTCCTTTVVDWNSRIGTYTYNQAVLQLGSPDKQATLSNGKVVAQWITLHGNNGTSTGPDLSSAYFGTAGQNNPQTFKNHVLQLTFGTDDKLVSWKKNY